MKPNCLASCLTGFSRLVDQELDLTWRVRTEVKQYLKEMDVPDRYVDLMYSVPPNEIRWITQKEFSSDFQGFIPEFKNWIDAKCDSHFGNREPNWQMKRGTKRMEVPICDQETPRR